MTAGNETLTVGDTINAGLGVDTLNWVQTAAVDGLPTGASITSVEKVNITSGSGVKIDTSTWGTTIATNVTAGAAAVDVTTAAASASIKGGTTVAVKDITDGTTLTSVTLDGNTAAATLTGDGIATVTAKNLVNGNADVTIANAKAHALTLNVNGVGTSAVDALEIKFTDATATSAAINSTGKAAYDVTLEAAKATAVTIAADETLQMDALTAHLAKTVTISGDSAVTIDAHTLDAKAVITSTNTKGVTFTADIATEQTFAGGAGNDSISLADSGTTANTMGAGDDKVFINGAFGGNGSVDGGEGTDTLEMTAANAQTLSASGDFQKTVSNFEKLSIGAVAANTTNTVKLANLDNISYVVSAGTGAAGTNETCAVQFTSGMVVGESITIAGRTVTCTSGTPTAAAVAAAFASGSSGGGLTVAGTLSGWTVTGNNETATFTSTVTGNVDNLVPTHTPLAAGVAPSVTTTTPGGAGVNEVAVVSFGALSVGQSVASQGLTITATGGSATAAEVAAAFAANTAGTFGNLTVSGSFVWGPDDTPAGLVNVPGNANVTVTAGAAGDVGDITATANPQQQSTSTENTTAGTDGSALVIDSMANNGTFELTAAAPGAVTVNMASTSGLTDALNVGLTANASIAAGNLNVAGVETINFTTDDTSTTPDGTVQHSVTLTDSSLTTVSVKGDAGLTFVYTGTNITSFDATGLTLPTADAKGVTWTTGALTDSLSSGTTTVSVKGSGGVDVINGAAVTDTTISLVIDGGLGGTAGNTGDTITGGAGKDKITVSGLGNHILTGGAGEDTITVNAGAATINNAGVGKDSITLNATGGTDTVNFTVANVVGSVSEVTGFELGSATTAVDKIGATIAAGTGWAADAQVRQSTATGAADARLVVLDGQTYSGLANAVAAADNLQHNAAEKGYLFAWSDGTDVHVSYATQDAATEVAVDEAKDLVVLHGVSIANVNLADFTYATA